MVANAVARARRGMMTEPGVTAVDPEDSRRRMLGPDGSPARMSDLGHFGRPADAEFGLLPVTEGMERESSA
ncbi:MAG: hypothetical protein ACTHQQ_18465 [Solirubrobacteraceae bacterium]